MKIKDIHEQAIELSLCANAYQFSQEFLGMHKSYYGMLKVNGKQPSTVSLVNLFCAIQSKINMLNNYSNQDLSKLQNIADAVMQEIKKRGSNKSHF
ncbi:DUF6626 family protein [Thalassotalea ganghwensis]